MIKQKTIHMVDLKGQYLKIKDLVDSAVLDVINETAFINGPAVKTFRTSLEKYLGAQRVIPCANGTDALQLAMMALPLNRGDEVIVPSFTYVATAEVIGLLGFTPVMVDVDPATFNITASAIESAITPKTKVVVPVHLFGQCADMEPIRTLCRKHGLYLIEDTAQAIGSVYTFSDGKVYSAGTMGDIGCTSFFPSKNLGCYGDGGAVYTNDAVLGESIQMVANHGQSKKYVHKVIGINSRLDSIQAAILNVKLPLLNSYSESRRKAADYYDEGLKNTEGITIPFRSANSTHVFHQYTIKVAAGKRDALKQHLEEAGIPSMVYYPVPLNEQEAFQQIGRVNGELKHTYELCATVLSLPMHTELECTDQDYIIDTIKNFMQQ